MVDSYRSLYPELTRWVTIQYSLYCSLLLGGHWKLSTHRFTTLVCIQRQAFTWPVTRGKQRRPWTDRPTRWI